MAEVMHRTLPGAGACTLARVNGARRSRHWHDVPPCKASVAAGNTSARLPLKLLIKS